MRVEGWAGCILEVESEWTQGARGSDPEERWTWCQTGNPLVTYSK